MPWAEVRSATKAEVGIAAAHGAQGWRPVIGGHYPPCQAALGAGAGVKDPEG